MKLLEVQSSVRLEKSISRMLSNQFVQAWKTTHSDAQHRLCDVGTNPPAHPTELWTIANYSHADNRTPEMTTALTNSENLIEELLWADRLLLGIPTYNFGRASAKRGKRGEGLPRPAL